MVAPVYSGAPIVICTGHGPISVETGQKPAKAHNQACPFAGNGVAPPPPSAPVLLAISVAYAAKLPLISLARVSVPGLAAPLPPAQAPPVLL